MDVTAPAAETLRFGYVGTDLGLALVALSAHGIAAILLGDERPALRRELGRAFPAAMLVEASAGVATTLEKVAALVATPHQNLNLPLDLRGSELERAVWQALRAIPAGETSSYGAIAKTLPVPATAREVGAACAANVLAVAVPCHRVVKAGGKISGYRWGVQRKRRLLNLEAAA
jgi:AraC family transcriptional regulator, regulatory protein of adaptative response / methylated-DNA-[protein]-cysteine methyltransferase